MKWLFNDGIPMWWENWHEEDIVYFIYPDAKKGFLVTVEDWNVPIGLDTTKVGTFKTLKAAKLAAKKHKLSRAGTDEKLTA